MVCDWKQREGFAVAGLAICLHVGVIHMDYGSRVGRGLMGMGV